MSFHLYSVPVQLVRLGQMAKETRVGKYLVSKSGIIVARLCVQQWFLCYLLFCVLCKTIYSTMQIAIDILKKAGGENLMCALIKHLPQSELLNL